MENTAIYIFTDASHRKSKYQNFGAWAYSVRLCSILDSGEIKCLVDVNGKSSKIGELYDRDYCKTTFLELYAVKEALTAMGSQDLMSHLSQRVSVTIFTDCQTVAEVINGNATYYNSRWMAIVNEIKQIMSSGKMTITHIKAHTKRKDYFSKGNESVNKAAKGQLDYIFSESKVRKKSYAREFLKVS